MVLRLFLLTALTAVILQGSLAAEAHEGKHGKGSKPAGKATTVKAVSGKTIQMSLSGLHCGGCTVKVRRALLKVTGVKAAEVNAQKQSAHIRFQKTAPSEAKLRAAVEATGYQVKSIKTL
jgi:copper chaperone CopZ